MLRPLKVVSRVPSHFSNEKLTLNFLREIACLWREKLFFNTLLEANSGQLRSRPPRKSLNQTGGADEANGVFIALGRAAHALNYRAAQRQ